jgi:hypothetical protein
MAGVADDFSVESAREIETPHQHITRTDLVIRWRSRTSANAAHAARSRAYDARVAANLGLAAATAFDLVAERGQSRR